MSALTQATIIVEAGETSGTLIQARAAIEQGRKLFILNSCFCDTTLTWPEKFAERGAIRVTDYEDIRRHLGPETLQDDDLSRFDHQYLTPDDMCFFFGEYTPGLGYKGSKTNDLILNFKKPPDRKITPQWKYKEDAIERIAEAFKRSLEVEKLQKVTLVPIPPSKVKGDPLYDDRMLCVLEN